MLKFRVEGQKLTWENPDEVVVAGTKKYLECYFEFDGDAWSGFEYIEAFFKNGRDKPIRMLLSANRIWKEDGLCLTAGDWSVYLCATTYNAEKEEIEKQITSSSVSIRVLAHGQFEDAQNSFESPEIANQYIAAMQVFEDAREKAEDERVEAENARNVFEEYNPDKTYVKGNKVAYEGSSYVLTADEALGTNPTDTGSWLCIAEKGDKGEQGQQGIKGEKGDKGEQGQQGIKGEKGDKGEQGQQGIKGEKGDKGDKGASGGKIFSYALGYGKDVEVGSYKMAIPPFELIENGIDYNDIIVDTDGGCIFQYVASIGDDEAMLPAEGLHCIANPNGEKGDKGDKGERGIQGVQGEKGKDAVLPAGNMRKRGDFSHLPNNVPVGEVIKVTETIYKDDTVLIPCKGGFDWYATDDDNISALGISKDTLLYEVMEALEGNILRGIVDGKTKITIEIIKYEDNLFYVRDLVEHSISALFGCSEKLEATVPFDSIRGVLEDYKKVLFEKGTYAISNGVSWESFSGEEFEKLKIENYHRDDEIYKIETKLSDNDFGFAYNDLENVSNEDFKRKAEEAGVGGGTSDAMVFKGVVDTLPNTANEGEVYKITNTTTSNLYVRHNGEWVEISKDGVTKAEMESYIEETLLGGEW